MSKCSNVATSLTYVLIADWKSPENDFAWLDGIDEGRLPSRPLLHLR